MKSLTILRILLSVTSLLQGSLVISSQDNIQENTRRQAEYNNILSNKYVQRFLTLNDGFVALQVENKNSPNFLDFMYAKLENNPDCLLAASQAATYMLTEMKYPFLQTLEELIRSDDSDNNNENETYYCIYMYCLKHSHGFMAPVIKLWINIQNDQGATLLHKSVQNNEQEIVDFLINAKADVNTFDNEGRTALYHAVQKNNPAMVKILLDAQADPNIADNLKATPLFIAMNNNATRIIELLINYGAKKINARTFSDFNTLDMISLDEQLEFNINNLKGLAPELGVTKSEQKRKRTIVFNENLLLSQQKQK